MNEFDSLKSRKDLHALFKDLFLVVVGSPSQKVAGEYLSDYVRDRCLKVSVLWSCYQRDKD